MGELIKQTALDIACIVVGPTRMVVRITRSMRQHRRRRDGGPMQDAMPLPESLRPQQGDQYQRSDCRAKGPYRQANARWIQKRTPPLLHGHGIGHSVIKTIGIILQNCKLSLDHYRLERIFDWCFGLDFHHALRTACRAEGTS